jgi:hypothetical protein
MLVSEIAGSIGDLAGKTLERLADLKLADDGATSLIQRATSAWKTPFDELTCEQLRLLLGQDLGTPWVAPLACLIVTRRPNATVSFYPGDLAQAILRNFPAVFAADPEGAREVLAADFAWIERLRETDIEFGTTNAADAIELLNAARALTA